MAQQTFPKTMKQEDLPKAAAGHEWVRNLMTQAWVQQAIDTPYACRVDNERYWSM